MFMVAAEVTEKKYSFEDAMEITGFGKYNIAVLGSCCLLILAMSIDMFGFSVIMPAVACDMQLTSYEQGLLSAMPLIGVMISSYAWGLCADTLGRRTTLLVAMPLGMIFNFIAGFAPNYWSLAVLKFLSGSLTSSANSAAFVLLGESVPRNHRSKMMFLMCTTIMITQLILAIFALPFLNLSFRIEIPWLALEYRPWRLLMQVLCLPGIMGCFCTGLMSESPKFLLCGGKEDETLHLLKKMYNINTGLKKDSFPVSQVFLDDVIMNTNTEAPFLRKMWKQTAPLFKPPLLANSLKLYYLLLCAYMTSTGYSMWVPSMTNAYFNGEDTTGLTFCQVAGSSAAAKNSTSADCDNAIKPMALYATMVYSALPGILTIFLSFIVGPIGKKMTTQLVFIISLICGILLLFVKIALLSIGLFFMFLYVALILGNVNSYLVELNPTHLRGMATCLSVVAARGFGFISVQLIASLVANYCTPLFSAYILLVAFSREDVFILLFFGASTFAWTSFYYVCIYTVSNVPTGLVVSCFLPGECKKTADSIKDVVAVDLTNTTKETNDIQIEHHL